MSMFRTVDMREGDPVSQIVRFAIPMLLGNVAQQLYNTVDSIIVGRFVGDNALAAVGSAGPILNLMIVLFIGISVGASIMVSQFFGAQKREDLAKAVGACITVTGAASVLIMIVGPLIAGPLLRLLNTPESIIGWCEEYLTIIFLGVLGGGYYNILSGVMRGLGDSASALRFLLVSTVVNTVLDYVFVAKFGMGVPGVAWATVIAQLVSAILALYKVMRLKDVFELKLHHLLPGRRYFGTLIRLGLPSGVTQAIFSMSMIVVQSLTNSFGEMFIAANVIVMRIDGFVMMPAFSLGTAMTTFAGQNIGAGLAAMGISAVITALILLFGRGLMGVFTTTQELIDLSFRMMKNSGARLHRHGSDAVSVRHHARGGGHRDADVDLDIQYDSGTCAAGLRTGGPQQDAGTAAGQLCHDVRFAADYLDHRGGADIYFVPDRALETESGRGAGSDGKLKSKKTRKGLTLRVLLLMITPETTRKEAAP